MKPFSTPPKASSSYLVYSFQIYSVKNSFFFPKHLSCLFLTNTHFPSWRELIFQNHWLSSWLVKTVRKSSIWQESRQVLLSGKNRALVPIDTLYYPFTGLSVPQNWNNTCSNSCYLSQFSISSINSTPFWSMLFYLFQIANKRISTEKGRYKKPSV